MVRLLSIALVLLTTLFPCQARWATSKDAPVEFIYYNRDTTVKANGQIEDIVECRLKILNEAGRSSGIQTFTYNGEIGKIEILEARTIVDGKEYKVSPDMIETKPLASSIQGFDQLMQVMVSFPHAAIGSELYLKYKRTDLQQPLPNYFASGYFFGTKGYWQKSKVTIKSELPFFKTINDPKHKLEVKEGKEGKYQTLSIVLKEPVYEELVDELMFSQLEPKRTTWVFLSTCDDFNKLTKEMAAGYNNVLSKPLPAKYQAIKAEAEKAKTLKDRINVVTSKLAESINYLGDWQTIKGQFYPRELEKVANTSVADCKDYSAATVAILRAMGYKANVAFVYRDFNYLLPEAMPSFYDINHAIVKVTDENGKALWIDPTNTISYSDGIFHDIANRPAYVIDGDNPTTERIPEIDYKRAKVIIDSSVSLKNGRDIAVQGTYSTFGEESMAYTGAALSNSQQSLEDGFIRSISDDRDARNKKVALPDLKSRIVKDKTFTFSYDQENRLIPTTAGRAILIDSIWPHIFLDRGDDDDGCLFLMGPSTLKRIYKIHNAGSPDVKALAYKLDYPWLKASRECVVKDHTIEIVETVEYPKQMITSDELNSPKYKEFKNILRRDCRKFAVIVGDGK